MLRMWREFDWKTWYDQDPPDHELSFGSKVRVVYGEALLTSRITFPDVSFPANRWPFTWAIVRFMAYVIVSIPFMIGMVVAGYGLGEVWLSYEDFFHGISYNTGDVERFVGDRWYDLHWPLNYR